MNLRRVFFPAAGYPAFYAVLCTGLALVQYLLLRSYTDQGAAVSALDAFLSQASLFLLLLPLWFLVLYGKPGRAFTRAGIVNALVGGGLLIAAWFLLMREGLGWLLYREAIQGQVFAGTLGLRMAFGIVTGLVVYLFFLSIQLRMEAMDAGKRRMELESLVQQTELQALKDQLNPHFIYNSLNAISSLTLTDPEKAREMVIKLSDFLRYSLKQDALQLTTLEKEMRAIELYLQIERVRFGDRLHCRFPIDERFRDLELPGLILQPLFENAVKHGVQQLPGQSGPAFRVTENEKEVMLEVSNYYDPLWGRSRGEGVGLENIRNRLRLHYGNGQLLQLEKKDNLFIARLIIPKLSD